MLYNNYYYPFGIFFKYFDIECVVECVQMGWMHVDLDCVDRFDF